MTNYTISRIGGRVKAASIGLDVLYPQQYEQFQSDPTPATAYTLYQQLRQLREQPTPEFLSAFFPHDGGKIRQLIRGAGFYHPILKTNQGPAGNFFGFEIGEARTGVHCILGSNGLAVPEKHFLRLLQEDHPPTRTNDIFPMVKLEYQIQEFMDKVITTYGQGALEDCAEALGALARSIGKIERKATVGRGLFFFCRPSCTDTRIYISEQTATRIETKTQELLDHASSKARDAMQRFRRGTSLEEAVRDAQAQNSGEPLALYVQPDVFIDRTGNPQIERINVPDLMMFLTELPPGESNSFRYIQTIADQLRQVTLERIAGAYGRKIFLLTRDEVLQNDEDTLEHLEMTSILRGLEAQAISREVIRADQVKQLQKGSEVLLLNINPYDPKYHELLRRVAADEIRCFPNPFLKALEGEMTTLPTHHITGKQKERFLNVIRPGTQLKDTSIFERHRAIDAIYAHGNIGSDVLYFTMLGERTPVPTIRHAVHSFFSLYHICKKHAFPDLTMREIPIGRGNSRLVDGNGGRMAVHRFLATVN